MTKINSLIEELRRQIKPLSDEDREILKKVYLKFRVTTDQLMSHPAELEELAEEFARIRGGNISGERLLQEMLRLRKMRQWPRLSKDSHAISA